MNQADCPKCNSIATNISPTKDKSAIKVFGCVACGYAFTEDGKPVVSNNKQLVDVFKAATEGQKTIMEMFGNQKLDPVTKAVLTTKMLEYGVQMWFDGLKQGILLGTVQEMKDGNGKTGSPEGNII